MQRGLKAVTKVTAWPLTNRRESDDFIEAPTDLYFYEILADRPAAKMTTEISFTIQLIGQHGFFF